MITVSFTLSHVFTHTSANPPVRALVHGIGVASPHFDRGRPLQTARCHHRLESIYSGLRYPLAHRLGQGRPLTMMHR